jgi:hypothetical protein
MTVIMGIHFSVFPKSGGHRWETLSKLFFHCPLMGVIRETQALICGADMSFKVVS